jgi:hypothetical protein
MAPLCLTSQHGTILSDSGLGRRAGVLNPDFRFNTRPRNLCWSPTALGSHLAPCSPSLLGFLGQKRERGTASGSPPQVFVVFAVAASAGRYQRCAPQERCGHLTIVCIPGGVSHTSFPVSMLPSYSCARPIARLKSTGRLGGGFANGVHHNDTRVPSRRTHAGVRGWVGGVLDPSDRSMRVVASSRAMRAELWLVPRWLLPRPLLCKPQPPFSRPSRLSHGLNSD